MKKILRPAVASAACLVVGVLAASATARADGLALEPLWEQTYASGQDSPIVTAADGRGGFVTVYALEGNDHRIRSVSSSGEQQWSISGPEQTPFALLPCLDGHLCLLTSHKTWVIAVDPGEVTRELPRASALRPADDGGWRLFDSKGFCARILCVASYTLASVDADGAVQEYTLRNEDGAPLALSGDGTLFTVVAGELHTLSQDGTLTPFMPEHGPLPIRHSWSAAGPATGSNPHAFETPTQALVVDDAQIVTLMGDCEAESGSACQDLTVTSLKPDGPDWSLDTGIPGAATLMSWSFQRAAEDEIMALVSYETDRPANWYGNNHRVLIMKATTQGEVIWQRHLLSGGYSSSELVPLPDLNALALVRPDDQRDQWLITLLDADSGALRSEYVVRCHEANCTDWRIDANSDGQLAAIGVDRAGSGARHLLFAQMPAETDAAIALDQTALNGAWYAARATGQGFNLRLHPTDQNDTIVFMPWFTFTVNDRRTDVDQLRWYTLEGRMQPGATATELDIAQFTDGRFVTPGQQRTTVGHARLWFPTCELGLLDYHFDETVHPPGSGIIALRPLLPAGDDCTQADGSTVTAQREANPAISGSWYDPGAPGQGLDIQHLSASSQGGDILFGTWHTFDDDVPEDDPDDQHWFTVQASSTGYDHETLTATIYQTQGRRLDNMATDQHQRVGEVDLVPQDCDRMQLRYRFDDTDAAGGFRDREGEVALYRLGECPPP